MTKKEHADLKIKAYELAAVYSANSAAPEYVIEKANKIYKWLLDGES